MRRVATSFEVVLSAVLLVGGLYMLYDGSQNKSINQAAVLIGGAVCFSLSFVALVSAIRSILWHRHMLRHAMVKRGFDGGGSHYHGI